MKRSKAQKLADSVAFQSKCCGNMAGKSNCRAICGCANRLLSIL